MCRGCCVATLGVLTTVTRLCECGCVCVHVSVCMTGIVWFGDESY